MTWVYKSKYKLDEKPEVAEILPICPKCHYILQLRPGEKAVFCPMCGERHFKDKNRKKNIGDDKALRDLIDCFGYDFSEIFGDDKDAPEST